MGPCHSDKSSRQVNNERSGHVKGATSPTTASSMPVAQFTKPKLLFNLLVSDDSESNDGYQNIGSGVLKSFDTETPTTFHHSFSSNSLGLIANGIMNPGHFIKRESKTVHNMDMEHLEKVEMARNKLKILLTTEPPDANSDTLAKSFSEPITPPLTRQTFELGKRTNSEGSRYRSLVLKKRQKDVFLGTTPKDNLLLTEDILKNKRMKNGCTELNDTDQLNLEFPDKPEDKTSKEKTSLLKKILSGADISDDLEPEYPNISKTSCDNVKRLFDNKRTLSNSDICFSLTSNLTSFSPSMIYSKSLPRLNNVVRLVDSSNQSLFTFLCNSVQYALCLPGFKLLPVDDKRPMIIKAAPRLILLHMAKENFQLEVCPVEQTDEGSAETDENQESKPTTDFVESLKMFIRRFQHHKINDNEFCYLKHITLYQYSDPNKSMGDNEQIRKSLLEAFENLRNQTIEDKSRYSQLLLQLHSLFLLNLKTLETLFFQPLLHSEGVESLKKFKHLYAEGGWFAEAEGQDRSLMVS